MEPLVKTDYERLTGKKPARAFVKGDMVVVVGTPIVTQPGSDLMSKTMRMVTDNRSEDGSVWMSNNNGGYNLLVGGQKDSRIYQPFLRIEHAE